MTARDEYWEEAAEIALEEAGVAATAEQIKRIGADMAGSHECYGMAFGDDVASQNLAAAQKREKQDLRDEIERERSKIHCRECDGSGRIVSRGPGTMGSDTECWKCRGEGRHLP